MKIAAILECSISTGGGFNQALNAIQQMTRIVGDKFEFTVFTCVDENIPHLNTLGISAKVFKSGWVDQFLGLCAMSQIGRKLQRKIRLVGKLERCLVRDGVDLVYFLSPTSRALALQNLNYIATVWDLCHRDTPEFPEVRAFNVFHDRELLYRNTLPPAFLILTDSTILSARISNRYGIDSERLLSMPFSPSPFALAERSLGLVEILKKYTLDEGYFFYPAQLWPHKNHIRILEALLQLRDNLGYVPEVVFSGGDQGNRSYLESFVAENSLESQVRLVGFVPAEEIGALYQGCLAVVMPTYFGPTNLPPLEAWMWGKPLIYSANLGEQVGDAARCVNPDNADELAEAMYSCTKPEIRQQLVEQGGLKLKEIASQREEAENILLSRLYQFEKRRSCWH